VALAGQVTRLRPAHEGASGAACASSALGELETIKRDACACRDKACAERVQVDFDTFLERHKDTHGDQTQVEKVGRLAGEMSECLAKC
jgi:hypothetical protein